MRQVAKNRRPVFDQEVGTLEVSIRLPFGEPRGTSTRPAKELGGELRSVLQERVESGNTPIKELYFTIDSYERIFWMTEKTIVS